MKVKYILILFCAIITLLSSCKKEIENVNIHNKEEMLNQNADSLELTRLIRNVYKWHMTTEVTDFPYKYRNQNDSVFVGIDWVQYENNIELLKHTDFFSTNFYISHKKVALTLDASIKKSDIKWRNINDGIPTWETGADNWCGCQDYPDNYWEIITINNLEIKNENANLSWTWDKELKKDSHLYKLTAKKEGGKWKINSLSGFKHFYSIEEYDKMMSE